MEFPQFRKLENGKSIYKIAAPNQFTELQQVGVKWFAYEFEVKQFPDLLRVQDMLDQKSPFIQVSAEEFQSVFLISKQ